MTVFGRSFGPLRDGIKFTALHESPGYGWNSSCQDGITGQMSSYFEDYGQTGARLLTTNSTTTCSTWRGMGSATLYRALKSPWNDNKQADHTGSVAGGSTGTSPSAVHQEQSSWKHKYAAWDYWTTKFRPLEWTSVDWKVAEEDAVYVVVCIAKSH